MQIAVIRTALKGKDIIIVLCADLEKQLLEASLNPIHLQNTPPTARTEDQMITDIGFRGFGKPVFVFHVSIIA